MKFEEAIAAMRTGARVRRPGWAWGRFLAIMAEPPGLPMERVVVNVVSGRPSLWTAGSGDIFAEDWEQVDTQALRVVSEEKAHARELVDDLGHIADYFQHWLDWQAKDRAKEKLLHTDEHTTLRWPIPLDGATPPQWPTRGGIAGIISAIRKAEDMARLVAGLEGNK